MEASAPGHAGTASNQPPEFAPRDLWTTDAPLREAVEREGAAAFCSHLPTYGALAGDELYSLGFEANRDRPRLRTHDRFGERIDRVEFHPHYHELMRHAIASGVTSLSWNDRRPGAHVARAALSYLHYQAESGTSCPLTMTHAAVPALQREPALAEWAAKATATMYDPADVPIARKRGVTIGMGMTEKQGGSDVRANLTRATPLGDDGGYVLSGHKWFFSAPMSDAFLVLAQAPGGLGCFLLPRWRPDGTRNGLRLMRLKDKLGDWSNASSEVEFDDAWALRIGEEGRGVPVIIEMVMLTRLDCMLGSSGLMRMALAQALHHARHRRTFGKRLVEHVLMRNVLADLGLEAEAALALSMRVARAVDAAPGDATEAVFARIATAVGKSWICKRAPGFVVEALECLGGNGYVEEALLARLYRQAPLNSIWEGSGNIQCLDVLRALGREPASGQALLAELDAASGLDQHLEAATVQLRALLADPGNLPEAGARRFVAQLAMALQASVLLRAGSPAAGPFCRSRLGEGAGGAFGTLPADVDFSALLERVLP